VNFFTPNYSGGGLNMNAPSGMGLRMPTTPSTIPGVANLQMPSNAMDIFGMGGVSPAVMQMASSLLGAGIPQGGAQPQSVMPAAPVQQAQLPMMAELPQTARGMQAAQQFLEMYGPQAALAASAENDAMMRQRIMGLLDLLGGR
jgi:hypothetical protein